MDNDYTDDLAGVENTLRRLIEHVGRRAHGSSWLSEFGVGESRVAAWRRRQEREGSNRGAGLTEDRLIYFSDFADLEEIVIRNWDEFEEALIDKARTEVYLRKLRELRNPDAHQRALTGTEKSLITGMAGELRTQATRFLSQRHTPDEYFPRLEALRDNLGNSFGRPGPWPVVRTGDVLEFYAEGWDPIGAELEYEWTTGPGNSPPRQEWSKDNRFTWRIQPDQVAHPAWLNCNMRGPRAPHAEGDRDAGWSMAYTVLPGI